MISNHSRARRGRPCSLQRNLSDGHRQELGPEHTQPRVAPWMQRVPASARHSAAPTTRPWLSTPDQPRARTESQATGPSTAFDPPAPEGMPCFIPRSLFSRTPRECSLVLKASPLRARTQRAPSHRFEKMLVSADGSLTLPFSRSSQDEATQPTTSSRKSVVAVKYAASGTASSLPTATPPQNTLPVSKRARDEQRSEAGVMPNDELVLNTPSRLVRRARATFPMRRCQ